MCTVYMGIFVNRVLYVDGRPVLVRVLSVASTGVDVTNDW